MIRSSKKILIASILIVSLIGAASYWIFWDSRSTEKPTIPSQEELPEEKVTLYYYSPESSGLVLIRRKASPARNITHRIKQIIRELKTEPAEPYAEAIALLPEPLKLRSIFIDNKIIYLNFSDHFVGSIRGTSEEIMLIYSIVNSVLANVKEEKQLVHFLVEGETIKTMGSHGEESGHITLRYPLGPRWNLTVNT